MLTERYERVVAVEPLDVLAELAALPPEGEYRFTMRTELTWAIRL